MFRTIATRALLAAALLATTPGTVAAQQEGTTPEGTEWFLIAYDAGGPELAPVPWDVVATLSLTRGQAVGSTGCNRSGGTYELDGESLSILQRFLTKRGCYGPAMAVETAYLAALPQIARWEVDSDASGDLELVVFDDDDVELLRFASSGTGLLIRQNEALAAELEAQQQVIKNLRARIKELEQGG